MDRDELEIDPQCKDLGEVLIDKPPFCSGTCSIPSEEFTVFYGKGEDARCHLFITLFFETY